MYYRFLILFKIYKQNDNVVKRKLLDNIHYETLSEEVGPGAKRDSMGRYSSRGYSMDDYRD